jgi:hypothetical protein
MTAGPGVSGTGDNLFYSLISDSGVELVTGNVGATTAVVRPVEPDQTELATLCFEAGNVSAQYDYQFRLE